jgi:transmembrane sensor
MTETSQEIYDQAAFWAARVDAGPLAPDDQARLDAWLDVDARHFGAFAQASAHLVPLSSLPTAQAQPDAPSRRRVLMTGSAAASVAALAGAGYFGFRYLREQRYATRIGELRVIPLTDGSVISLNTDSEVVVHYTKAMRAIDLVEGEALFDVAKNKERPFIVRAGNTQVRAVGTSFTVLNLPGQPVKVLVREGIVEVSRPGVPVAPPVRVAMNARAVAPVDAPIISKPVETAEVTRELAWRVGRIAFHGETLAVAATEFARYSDIRIRIDDPAIAQEKVTGLFVSADPVGFSKAVATSFDLHAEIGDKEILLTR